MSTYTQVETNGLYELTDAARSELISSKYYNEDLAPTSVSQRTWTTYNISMLWVGMAICVPSLTLATGLVTAGISPWLAILNVALGNFIILIPIQLNANIGCRYGISFPGFARITFGSRGAQLPILTRAFTACGWVSVLAWVGGGAIAAALGCFIPKFADPDWTVTLPSWGGMQTHSAGIFIGYIIFILLMAWVAYKGVGRIRVLQNIGGPILLALLIGLLAWSVKIGSDAGFSFGDIMNQHSTLHGRAFWGVYLTGLMGNIAFWAMMAFNIPDFSRYARSQKAYFRGQLYGLPVPMVFCAFVGAFYAQAATLFNAANGLSEGKSGWYDPFDAIHVLYNIDSKATVLITALGVVIATLTTCIAANLVSAANGFANLSPAKISYKKGVFISILIAFFVLQAWWIYGSGNQSYVTWLNAYGTVLAPLAAIFISDYFFCKNKRIDLSSIFKGANGRYWYSGGFNTTAIIAWVVAFICPLLTYFGLDGMFWKLINSISYIWSFTIGFIVYTVLMKTRMTKGSYVSEEEHENFTKRVSEEN